MRLYDYQFGSGPIKFSKRIYAEHVESSLKKWLFSLAELEMQVQEWVELKPFIDQGHLSEISRVDNSQDMYFMTMTWRNSQVTIFIHEEVITPDFIAELNYLRTDQGGRKGFVASGYRPHIKFSFSKNLTTGEQVFLDQDKVFPGESVRAQIRILDHETFKSALYQGLEFEFAEGTHRIGTGIIVEVVNNDLRRN